MSSQHRHLAAILFTDIVGYTAMMQQDERHAVQVVMRYLSVLQSLVTAHDGKIINDYGDGSLCMFPSAYEAINCAVELQGQFKEKPAVPLRIGLHVGEIFFEDGKVFGDGVNIASRIQSLGQANSILFSGEILNKIRNHPEFKAVSIGEFEFKNVEEPMEIFALTSHGFSVPVLNVKEAKLKNGNAKQKSKFIRGVIIILILLTSAVSLFFYQRYNRKETFVGGEALLKKNISLAVLPFKQVGGNQGNQSYTDGIWIATWNNLCQIKLFSKVIGMQTMEQYRDTRQTMSQIGKYLDVTHILEGRVQFMNDQVKVYISLNEAASDKQIQSWEFPVMPKDSVFQLQASITEKIADGLNTMILPEEVSLIRRIPTSNKKAWDKYLNAQSSFLKYILSPEKRLFEFQECIASSRAALSIDPTLADAYSLLAQAYWWKNFEERMVSPDLLDSVRWYSIKALQFNDKSIYALIFMSALKANDGQRDSALFYSEKAIKVNPNLLSAQHINGLMCMRDQQWAKALDYETRAIKLDPLSIYAPYAYWGRYLIFLGLGDTTAAKRELELSLKNDNSIWNNRKYREGIWRLELVKGNLSAALVQAKLFFALDSIEGLKNLAFTYHLLRNDSLSLKYYQYYLKGNPGELPCNGRYSKIRPIHLDFNERHRWAAGLWNTGNRKLAEIELRACLNELDTPYNDGWLKINNNYDIAAIHAFLGHTDSAIYYLSSLKDPNDWRLGDHLLIRFDPMFDRIRNQPRFKQIVDRIEQEKKQQLILVTKNIQDK